jgi:hypothetical protein
MLKHSNWYRPASLRAPEMPWCLILAYALVLLASEKLREKIFGN